MKNLDTILSKLPSLTQKELAQVRAMADNLINHAHVQSTDPTVLVWDALTKVLNVKMSFIQLHNIAAYKQWKQHAPACLVFIKETFPTTNRSKVVEMAVLQILLTALRDNLKTGHIPVTVGTMISNLGRVPQVFELCYPGYKESGLCDLILQSMQQRVTSGN